MGVSLLRNAGPYQTLLLVASRREYEDLTVRLCTTSSGRTILAVLRTLLHRGRPKIGNGGGRGASWLEGGISGPTLRAASSGGKSGRGWGLVLPLFDAERITLDIDRAFMLMSEVQSEDLVDAGCERGRGESPPREGWRRVPHIVMTGKHFLTGENIGYVTGMD